MDDQIALETNSVDVVLLVLWVVLFGVVLPLLAGIAYGLDHSTAVGWTATIVR